MSDLETKVAEQLSKMNAEDSDYDPTLDEPNEVINTPVDDSQAGSADDNASDDNSSDKTDNTDDATGESTGDDDNNAEAGGDDESAIPDSYLRAAVHQGWKEEEVKELWKDDPEKAERLLKANLTATNNLSNQWSQLGQQQMNVQTSPAVPVTTPEAPVQKTVESFTGLDINKLKGEYDDDNLIDDVIKPMNDLLIKMNTKLNSVESRQTQTSQNVQAEQNAASQEKKDAVGQQIDGFFNSLKSKELKEFYGEGSDWLKFDETQADNRIKLLTQADQIKVGATYQGKEIDNETAMNLANLIMSSHLAEQKIINDIKNTLVKREKSLSLKPSGSRASSTSDNDSDKSEKGLLKTVKTFMKKRGIKQY